MKAGKINIINEHLSSETLLLMKQNQQHDELLPAFNHIKECELCREALEGIREMPDTAILTS